MRRPPLGLCLPCQLSRVVDGDTIEVTITGGVAWRLRLIDCWCPEVRGADREKGLAAKRAAEQALEKATSMAVFVPLPTLPVPAKSHDSPLNLLGLLTFDRVPAWLYLDETQTLNALLVKQGHATKTKRGADASTPAG